jgi:hypothetical protein
MIEQSIGSPEDPGTLWAFTSLFLGVGGAASGPLMAGKIALGMNTFQLQPACAFKRVNSTSLGEVT